ncbi:dipeptide ABC transporter ATP-binding protein [Agrobacterium vitis]|uniref:dipeptide ABC transporter ATP-binding protein n=1 Tax=Agrobacterium vitis TaxID=373 RepID=UPI0020358F7B|nr:ABC transporter ATP-binding protein [Agrobacterium vitis]MCM2450092.1 ABC transporter ATP-binding protein [Agrobacterium vitis]
MTTLLTIEDMTISVRSSGDLVRSCNLTIDQGEVIGIVGESGSGKTMVAKSILGLLPPGVAIAAGAISLLGRDMARLTPKERQKIRGGTVGMIFQEPMTSLNPSMTIGKQLEEGLRLHRPYKHTERQARIVAMLERIGFSSPAEALDRYPHQFSGGMRQRIMIASVMLLQPALLIADEPTTALDALIQKDVLELMMELARENNTAILLVSHDLTMISRYTGRTIVMAKGEIVEAGLTGDVMAHPAHPYTRKLLASVPKRSATRPTISTRAIVEIQGLTVDYQSSGGLFRKSDVKRAVENIDIAVYPGEVVAVIGESGSGKTTVGRTAAGLLQPSAGRLLYDGRAVIKGGTGYRDYRRNCQMVFQDPYSSLNPRMTISAIVAEPLRNGPVLTKLEKIAKTSQMLEEVGLPAQYHGRFPHQLSGGQRQRVAIARALISGPKFVVADEPVSALDVTVRAQVLDLFNTLQHRHGFSCLFITHDLEVVDAVADRVIVMRAGQIVESGSKESVLDHPKHDYTRKLLASR